MIPQIGHRRSYAAFIKIIIIIIIMIIIVVVVVVIIIINNNSVNNFCYSAFKHIKVLQEV